MTRDAILKHALSLSADERVRLIDDLLDSMIDPTGCPELTSDQQAELLRRLAADRADAGQAIAWDEVEARVTKSR